MPKPRSAGPSEHQSQAAFFDWWRAWAPAHGYPARLGYSVPNGADLGGSRNRFAHVKYLKAEGLTPGVLDVNIDIPHGRFHGLRIEFKAGKNKLSDEQAAHLKALFDYDYCAHVAWSTEDAIAIVKRYFT